MAAGVAGLVLGVGYLARAGYNGNMNGSGVGSVTVTVSSSTLQTTNVKSATMLNPSASIPPATGYSANAALPTGASPSTVGRVKGSIGYKWTAVTTAYNGDKSDSEVINQRTPITPADCAELNVDTSYEPPADGSSGRVIVQGTATEGTAILLRGYEWKGTGIPQSTEELAANSTLKWDMLLVGPFVLDVNNCTALVIPVTTADTEKLYFAVDTVAESKPMVITCPPDVDVSCGGTVEYPAVTVEGGCGEVTVDFDPPADALPAGTTEVLVTATDSKGSQATCSFLATRLLDFHGFYSPIGKTGGSCGAAAIKQKLGSKIPVKFDVTCGGVPVTTGQPTLAINKCLNLTPILTGVFQSVANEWHFNWDTTGLTKGTYQLVVTLQDGTTREVFVDLTK